MARPVPRNEESPFRIHELFFSKTDRRGVILTGNRVFQRVSGYALDQLIGAPHNLIRHPDMPKVVFKYLWDCLGKDQSVVAYVKNLNAEGKYYWVLAAVFPVDQGYVSIRLKPSTEILGVVRKLYEELLDVEKREGVDASFELLVRRIGELGFSSYREFSRIALVQEMESREKRMIAEGTRLDGLASSITTKAGASTEEKALLDLLRKAANAREDSIGLYSQVMQKITSLGGMRKSLRDESEALRTAYETIQHLSINMSVEADRAGEEGRTLAVISSTFQTWAEEVRSALNGFVASTDSISEKLESTSFGVAASRFQLEMMAFFTFEVYQDLCAGRLAESGKVAETRDEFSPFIEMTQRAFASAASDVAVLQGGIRGLQSDLKKLREALNALYIIRQNGRVEISRMAASSEALTGHITDMAKFLERVDQGMGRIDEFTSTLAYDLTEVRESLSRIQGEFARISLV